MRSSLRALFDDMDNCMKNRRLDLLGKLHRWGVDDEYHTGALERPSVLSFRELARRHDKTLKFLWLNTYLLPEVKLDAVVTTQSLNPAAPDRMARAQEIGNMIKNECYDVAALCEVWTADSRETILNNWSPWPVCITGPGNSQMEVKAEVAVVSDVLAFLGAPSDVTILTVDIMSSGLFTLLPGYYGLLSHQREKFNTEGVLTRDSDAWANKGILQVVVETGYGSKIEFYSAHLISGNDLIKESGETETVVSDVTQAQIDQLVDFINRTHNPSNVIVVAGDFNISNEGASNGYLSQRLENDSHLEDIWDRYSQAKYFAEQDGTMSCPDFQDDPLHNQYIWDNPGGVPVVTPRYDRVFLQKPSSSHDICVNISRPRRRHFKRTPSPDLQIATLSDHVGIEFQLFITDMHVPAQPGIG